MTREDTDLIARGIRATRERHGHPTVDAAATAEATISLVVSELCKVLRTKYPEFDAPDFWAKSRPQTGGVAKAASELEADGWTGPAADLREGMPPETVMERVRKCDTGVDEVNAITTLYFLVKEANR